MKDEDASTDELLTSADNEVNHSGLRLEKPLGIGFVAGSIIGLLNALILSFSLVWSILAGAMLGMLVCSIACPAMRSVLKARKVRLKQQRILLAARPRSSSVFTSLE